MAAAIRAFRASILARLSYLIISSDFGPRMTLETTGHRGLKIIGPCFDASSQSQRR